MIWESLVVMTVLDVAIILMSTVGILLLARRRGVASPVKSGMILTLSGAALLGSTYLLDLGTMWVLPLFVPRAEAMSFMRDLHLNYSWIINTTAVGLLFVGIIQLLKKLYAYVEMCDESELRYRSLFEQVPLAIFEEDFSEVLRYLEELRFRDIEDFGAYLDQHPEIARKCSTLVRVLAANESALRLTGLTETDVVYADISKNFMQESYSAFERQLKAIQCGDLHCRTQVTLHTVTGHQFVAILDWRVALGAEETLTRVFVTLTDVTDRVHDQKVLKEMNSDLEKLVADRTATATAASEEINRWFDISSDMICILGTDGYVKKVNRAWELTLGYSEKELLVEPLINLVHPDDREATIESRAKVVSLSERICNDTNRYRHKDGSYRWLAWSAQYDPELRLTYGIARDVTKDVEITEANQSERQALEHLVAERTVELGAAIEGLKQKNEEWEQLVASTDNNARQQQNLVDLGRIALVCQDSVELMNATVQAVAKMFKAQFAQVFELIAGDDHLVLRAGIGWDEGLVGSATVGIGTESQAGYTLVHDGAVRVADLRLEKRFVGCPLQLDHKVVSSMSVVVRSRQTQLGVLGVHTSDLRSFTEQDARVLEAAANILAEALERLGSEALLKQSVNQLAEANAELTGINRLAVGREMRMVELKRQVNALLEKSGAQPVYDISFSPEASLAKGDGETGT